jgi:hypothetical protein
MPWELTGKMDHIPVFAVSPPWDSSLGVSSSLGMGFAFDPGDWAGRYPVRADLENDIKLDGFSFCGNTVIVGQAAKDVIESLEPGLHQFLPIDVFARDGSLVPGPWYNLRFGQSIGAILSWESGFDGEWWLSHKGRPLTGLPAGSRTLVFSGPAVSGKHLWCNLGVHGPASIFISEVLKSHFDRLGYPSLYLTQYPAVDLPWDPELELKPVLDWLEQNPDQVHGRFDKDLLARFRRR